MKRLLCEIIQIKPNQTNQMQLNLVNHAHGMLVVRRNNSDSAYQQLVHRGRVGLAYGQCGAGKSTYAVLGLCKLNWISQIILLEPSDRIRDSLDVFFTDRKAHKVRVSTYKNFLKSNNSIGRSTVVLLDECHTRSAYTLATIAYVLQRRLTAILITATPNDELAAGADGLVVNEKLVDSKASFNYVKDGELRNTIWDPKTWNNRTSMVTYPVTNTVYNRLKSYYEGAGYFVRSKPGEAYMDKTVYLLSDDESSGITVDADILIDTGYIVEDVYDRDGVMHSDVVRCDITTARQRASRIGRRGVSGLVIAHTNEYRRRSSLSAYVMDAVVLSTCLGVRRTMEAITGVTLKLDRDACHRACSRGAIGAYGRYMNVGGSKSVVASVVLHRAVLCTNRKRVNCRTTSQLFNGLSDDLRENMISKEECCARVTKLKGFTLSSRSIYLTDRKCGHCVLCDPRVTDARLDEVFAGENTRNSGPGPRALCARLTRYSNFMGFDVRIVICDDDTIIPKLRNYDALDAYIRERRNSGMGPNLTGSTLLCYVQRVDSEVDTTEFKIGGEYVPVRLQGFAVYDTLCGGATESHIRYVSYLGVEKIRSVMSYGSEFDIEMMQPRHSEERQLSGVFHSRVTSLGSRLNRFGTNLNMAVTIVLRDVIEETSTWEAVHDELRDLKKEERTHLGARSLIVYAHGLRVNSGPNSGETIVRMDSGNLLVDRYYVEIEDLDVDLLPEIGVIEWVDGAGMYRSASVYLRDERVEAGYDAEFRGQGLRYYEAVIPKLQVGDPLIRDVFDKDVVRGKHEIRLTDEEN